MLFDTHAHYTDNQFRHDRYDVIQDALESGVKYILNASYNFPSLAQSLSLAKKFDFVYASVGIHPHYAKDMDEETLRRIEDLARNRKVVAIGEIGLDYYRNLSPHEVQKKWFIAQISLAKRMGLPIIVHSRDAYPDVLDILRSQETKGVNGVMHSYAGSVEMSKKFMALDFYISISGPVTYKSAKDLVDVAKSVPLDRLLVETDCPYLAPEPHRGKRNDSRLVRYVAEKIAQIRGVSAEEIENATTENGKRLFRISTTS